MNWRATGLVGWRPRIADDLLLDRVVDRIEGGRGARRRRDRGGDGRAVGAAEVAGDGVAALDGLALDAFVPQAVTTRTAPSRRAATAGRRRRSEGVGLDMAGIVARVSGNPGPGGPDIAFLTAWLLDPESARPTVCLGRTRKRFHPSLPRDRGRRLGRRFRSLFVACLRRTAARWTADPCVVGCACSLTHLRVRSLACSPPPSARRAQLADPRFWCYTVRRSGARVHRLFATRQEGRRDCKVRGKVTGRDFPGCPQGSARSS